MTEKLKQIIKEEIEKLPTEVQDAINSLDWIKTTKEIGEKYSFDESKINDFQIQTLLILTGLEESDSYAKNIENEVGINEDKAQEISKEISQKIFVPIVDAVAKNIEKKLRSKDCSWQQTVNFILSGGSYTTFISKKGEEGTPSVILPMFSIKKENLKDKFHI